MTLDETMVFNNMTDTIKNLNQSKSIYDMLILKLKGHNRDIIDEAEIMTPVQIKTETKPKAETKDKTMTKAVKKIKREKIVKLKK